MPDAVGIHADSWKKHETGQARPSIDALKKIAVALHVGTDFVLFNEHERGPGEDLALEFEALKEFSVEKKHTVRELLEGVILKHQAHRWSERKTPSVEPINHRTEHRPDKAYPAHSPYGPMA